MKVFFHNSTGGIFFNSKEEAKFIISEKKYSLLNKISPMMKINEKYEFLLEYPTGYSNQWRQSKTPLEEQGISTEEDYNVTGYEEVNITMRQNSWGGLALSTHSSSLIDGSISKSNWHYEIGQTSAWDGHDYKIPANTIEMSSYSVKLWIRIKENLISCFFNQNSKCERFTSLRFFYFVQFFS
jgi:hypothetical protein